MVKQKIAIYGLIQLSLSVLFQGNVTGPIVFILYAAAVLSILAVAHVAQLVLGE